MRVRRVASEPSDTYLGRRAHTAAQWRRRGGFWSVRHIRRAQAWRPRFARRIWMCHAWRRMVAQSARCSQLPARSVRCGRPQWPTWWRIRQCRHEGKRQEFAYVRRHRLPQSGPGTGDQTARADEDAHERPKPLWLKVLVRTFRLPRLKSPFGSQGHCPRFFVWPARGEHSGRNCQRRIGSAIIATPRGGAGP